MNVPPVMLDPALSVHLERLAWLYVGLLGLILAVVVLALAAAVLPEPVDESPVRRRRRAGVVAGALGGTAILLAVLLGAGIAEVRRATARLEQGAPSP